MKDKSVNVVLASSDSYMPQTCIALHSIVVNSSDVYKYYIYILNDGIKTETIELIKNRYKPYVNIEFVFLDVKNILDNMNIDISDGMSKLTYARLFIPELLPDVDRVVYVDGDTVCLIDISELFNIDLQGNVVAAVRDYVLNIEAWNNTESISTKEYLNSVLLINEEGEYINAGVMLMDLHQMRQKLSYDYKVNKVQERKWKWYDQDVINQALLGEIFYLPPEYNVIPIVDYKKKNKYMMKSKLFRDYALSLLKPKIVHYAARVNPINYKSIPCEEYFYKYQKDSLLGEGIKRSVRRRDALRIRLINCLPYESRLRNNIRMIYLKIKKLYT